MGSGSGSGNGQGNSGSNGNGSGSGASGSGNGNGQGNSGSNGNGSGGGGSASGSGNSNGNGQGSSSGNGNGQGNSGSNGNGSGSGASGSGNGNGQGNSGSNGNGSGSGASGSGNGNGQGNSGSNGNGSGEREAGSGSGNGNGQGNSGSNGNGSGSGASGSGNGNGQGNSGSNGNGSGSGASGSGNGNGQGNSGSNGNGSGSGASGSGNGNGQGNSGSNGNGSSSGNGNGASASGNGAGTGNNADENSSVDASGTTSQGSSNGAPGTLSPAGGGATARAANADHEGRHGFEPGEVVVLGNRPDTLARVQRLGFRLIEARPLAALGLSVLKLGTPPGLDARQAVALLHARYPELTADVNSLYGTYETEAAQVVSLPAPDYARRMIHWSGGEGCGAGLRIGMIDSALAAGLPTFAGRKLHQRSFVEPGHAAADPAHGTAIAALLVGAPDPAHPTAGGLLPDADLYAAAVFERQGGQSEADAFAIAAALDWMVQNRVAVVNVSLAGDNNALMALAVHRASARGTVLVAAAGNAGPDAPPAYPGALPEVIAVTAVDQDGAVFPEANRGDYIAFAAPGVRIWVPDPDGQGRYADRHLLRGTLRARHRGAGDDAGRARPMPTRCAGAWRRRRTRLEPAAGTRSSAMASSRPAPPAGSWHSAE